MADVRCPHCDALNSADAERCWNCQQDLPAAGAGKDDSGWLDSLREDGSSGETPWGSDANSPEDTTPAGESFNDSPDWLSRIRDRSQSEMAQPPTSGINWDAIPSDDAEKTEDLPDWLKDMAGEEGESSGQNDWLNALGVGGESDSTPANPFASDPGDSANGASEAEPDEEWLRNLQSWQSAQEPGDSEETPAKQTPVGDQSGSRQTSSDETQSKGGAESFPAPSDTDPTDLGWLKSLSTEDSVDDSDQGFEDEAPQAAAPEPFSRPDDGMDWLSRFSADDSADTPAGTPAETSPAPAFDTSDFLSDWEAPLEEEASKPEEPQKPQESSSSFFYNIEDEDWSSAIPAQEQPEDLPQERKEEPGLPSWLFTGDDEETPSAASTLPDAFSLEEEPPAQEPEQADISAIPGTLPDWMRSEVGPGQAFEPSEEAQPVEDAEETPAEITPAETPEQTPATPYTPFLSEELPDWLSEKSLEPPVVEPEDKPAFVFDETGEFAEPVEPEDHPFAEEEMPEWLESGAAAEDAAEAAKAKGSEIAPGQLPGWLEAMRPVEAVAPGEAAAVDDSHMEKSGPLAGIPGALPSESISGQYRKPPVYSMRLHVSDKQRAHAAMLEESIADESKPSELRPQSKGSSQVLMRLLIAVALIGLLIFSGALSRTQPQGSDTSFGYINFRTQVEGVTEGAPVLVAFEYQPAYSAEMRLASSGVLEQLLARGARITAVSTTPAGPVLAEDLITQAADAAGVTNLGDRFVNLGYLAGGTLSLQEFAIRPQEVTRYQFDSATTGKRAWDSPALAGVQSLDNFSLAIVLTDTPDVGRAWVEQVAPFFGKVPLLMITSAQAAPLMQPYVASGQVDGLIAGLLGGSYFAVPSQAQVQPGYWNAFYAGVRVAIAFIVIGILLQAFLSLFKGPKA